MKHLIPILGLVALVACGQEAPPPAPACEKCQSADVTTAGFETTCAACKHVKFGKRNGDQPECGPCKGTGRDPAKAARNRVPFCRFCRGTGAVVTKGACWACFGTKQSRTGTPCVHCKVQDASPKTTPLILGKDVCSQCRGDGIEPLPPGMGWQQSLEAACWPCTLCKGSGAGAPPAPKPTVTCTGCGGSGRATFGPDKKQMACAVCKGTGRQ